MTPRLAPVLLALSLAVGFAALCGCDTAPQPPRQSPSAVAADSRPPAVIKGEERFARLGCNTCHSEGSSSGPGHYPLEKWGQETAMTDGTKVLVDEAYIRESIEKPSAKVVAGYKPVMPDYSGQLNPGDVDAIVAYLKWLDSPAK